MQILPRLHGDREIVSKRPLAQIHQPKVKEEKNNRYSIAAKWKTM